MSLAQIVSGAAPNAAPRPKGKKFTVRILFQPGRRKPLIYTLTTADLKREKAAIEAARADGTPLPFPYRPGAEVFDVQVLAPNAYHAMRAGFAKFIADGPRKKKAARFAWNSHSKGPNPYQAMLNGR